jgi:hypothetical protein
MILAAVAVFASSVAAKTGDMTWFNPVSFVEKDSRRFFSTHSISFTL